MIPRIVHKIWLGASLTDDQLYSLLETRNRMPGVEVVLWSDRLRPWEDGTSLMIDFPEGIKVKGLEELWNRVSSSPELKPIYHQLRAIVDRERFGWRRNYAAASDVLRLLVLYAYGGLYLDMDVVLKKRRKDKDKLDSDTEGDSDSDNDDSNVVGRRAGAERIFREYDSLSQQQLGFYIDEAGATRYYGNAVLIALEHSNAIRTLLYNIVWDYCYSEYRDYFFDAKRDFNDSRVRNTVNATGPILLDKLNGKADLGDKIQDGAQWKVPEGVYIRYGTHFWPVDGSAVSYSTPPKFPRRSSF